MACGTADPTSEKRKLFWLRLLKTTAPEFDLVSATPHLHLAFILRIVSQFLEDRNSPKKRLDDLTATLVKVANLSNADKILVSGSTAEGLFIPEKLTHPDSLGKVERNSADIDIMVLDDTFTVSNSCTLNTVPRVVFNSSGCHSGYTRLNVIGSRDSIRRPTERIGEANYLCNQHALSGDGQKLFEIVSGINNAEQDQASLAKTVTSSATSRQGPALTIERFVETVVSSAVVRRDYDIVPAVKGEWPDAARVWASRKRPSLWPSIELVSDIVAGGCNIVGVAHSRSAIPSIEWRLSFSSAEILLAHSLTPFQRKCYRLFKMVCSVGITPKKVIATYFLKTTFFWLCEELPISTWAEWNISFILLSCLDRLLYFISRKYLPNFFIPQNNMIDHILPEKIQTAAKSIIRLRSNPLRYIFRFSEVYPYFPDGIPWHTTLQHIITDSMIYPFHNSLRRSIDSFCYCLRRSAYLYSANQLHHNALASFNDWADLIEIREIKKIPYRFAFAAYQSTCLQDDLPPVTSRSHTFHEYLLTLVTDPAEEAAILHSLGYIYLVQGQSGVDTATKTTKVKSVKVIIKPVDPNDVEPVYDRIECLEKSQAYLKRANSLMESNPLSGHWDPSIGTQYMPKRMETLCRLSHSLFLLGRFDECEEYIQEVLERKESSVVWMAFQPYEKGLYAYDLILSTVRGADLEAADGERDKHESLFSHRLSRGRNPGTSCATFALYIRALLDMCKWYHSPGDGQARGKLTEFSSDSLTLLEDIPKFGAELQTLFVNDLQSIKHRLSSPGPGLENK